jgi:hypothetical protein
LKPRNVERVPYTQLAPYERKELEAILASHRKGNAGDPTLRDRYLSDFGDSSAWWLMLMIAGLGGAGACASQLSGFGLGVLSWLPRMIDDGDYLMALRSLQYPAGFVVSLAVLIWTATTWIRNHGRRGYAITSFATIRVKGPRLAMVRHADVSRIEWTKHATRTQSFSVLVLTAGDDRRLTLYVHAGWVRTAIEQIDQSRAAAGLPAIQGNARKLPD